jgi:hypothetical protein
MNHEAGKKEKGDCFVAFRDDLHERVGLGLRHGEMRFGLLIGMEGERGGKVRES